MVILIDLELIKMQNHSLCSLSFESDIGTMKSATVASTLSVHISKTFRKIKYIVFSCQRCQHREHRQPHQHCQHGQRCQHGQHCQRHQRCHCHLVLTTSTGLATRVAVTPATAALAKWHLNLVVIRGFHVSWLSSSWLSG